MSELLEAAAARWVEAAGLLAAVGRVPAALLGWLGPGWSGPAARAYGEWAGGLEAATRRAAGALHDAGDAARRQAGQGPGSGRAVDLGWGGMDAASRSITAVPVPGQRRPADGPGWPASAGEPADGPVRLLPVLGGRPDDAAFPGATDGPTVLVPSPQDGPAQDGPAHDGPDHDGPDHGGPGHPGPAHHAPAHHAPAHHAPGSHAPGSHAPAHHAPGSQADGAAGPHNPTDHPSPHGRLDGWIQQAIAVLRAHGYRADQLDPHAIAAIVAHESAGDPRAVNDWDANAARGTPSMGLMQTIAPTFERYHLPGHGQILDPVDNIIAGVRYAVDRYGSMSRVPGVLSLHAGRDYRGY